MFQLITADVVSYTVTNISFEAKKYKAYLPAYLAMPKDFISDLGNWSESLI